MISWESVINVQGGKDSAVNASDAAVTENFDSINPWRRLKWAIRGTLSSCGYSPPLSKRSSCDGPPNLYSGPETYAGRLAGTSCSTSAYRSVITFQALRTANADSR